MTIYRGIYTDTETNAANENIQAVKRLDIIDTAGNPYNIVVTSEVVGPNITFTFTFDTLPANATGTSIGYSSDGGINWLSNTGGVVSPRTLTVPFSAYLLTFTIQTPTGNIYWSNEDTIVPLEMTDDPVRDIVIDNDEDKFTTIRSRQFGINIYSSNTISINTFSIGADDRFKVNYYIDDVLNFTGFLSMGDISQEFMPDPNVISMIAVDGLGFLNDIPLTNFDGDTPQNENAIIDYLLWALSKTGLQLNLRACFNIREVTAQDLNNDATGIGHFYKWCYLDAKTFEDEVGTCINCYDVISYILGEEAFIFQYLGEWRIQRVDEMEHGLLVGTWFQWNYQGNFLGKYNETHEGSIGIDDSYSWMNDDCLMTNDRLVKESRLTYRYELPEEIPCNIDFERGDAIDDSGSERTFELDCWEKKRENYPTSGLIPATVSIYVQRIYVNDYEKERYVVIPYAAVSSNLILSSNIYVNEKDKFSIGMSRRLSSDVSGSGFYRDNGMQVRLIGDDGTYWTLQGETSAGDTLEWVQSDSDFLTNNKYFWFEGDVDRDMTEPESLYGSTESPPIPVAGYIQLLAHQTHQASWNRDTYIDSVSFTYIPYINGSYQVYTGQQHIVAQTENTRNIRDKEVKISDSPARLYKGALLIADSPNYVLAGLFYNAATEPDGPVYPKPYGEIQAFDVWNQYNRTMVKFDGTVDKSNPAPTMVNKWFMTDPHPNSNNRIFLLLHYEYDTHLCEWTGVFIEVSNSIINKQYTGNSFKYLTK